MLWRWWWPYKLTAQPHVLQTGLLGRGDLTLGQLTSKLARGCAYLGQKTGRFPKVVESVVLISTRSFDMSMWSLCNLGLSTSPEQRARAAHGKINWAAAAANRESTSLNAPHPVQDIPGQLPRCIVEILSNGRNTRADKWWQTLPLWPSLTLNKVYSYYHLHSMPLDHFKVYL